MDEIKSLVKRYFKVSENKLSKCSSGHHYCLNCFLCRANHKDLDMNIWTSARSEYLSDKQKLVNIVASNIDHTLLKSDAKTQDIISLCDEADYYRFCSVCINPSYIDVCKKRLSKTEVKVCSVIGFPLGATLPIIKKHEAIECLQRKVDEIDMVINISYLKELKLASLIDEIKIIAELCLAEGVSLKCIIETCLLTEYEKIIACLAIKKAGALFIKTSTGFSTSGAKIKDIYKIRKIVGPKMGIKASGGIASGKKAILMINSGATRIGSSKSVKIVNDIESKKYYI